MFVPKRFGHREPNEFTLYGFTYPTIAHWIVIQMSAKNMGKYKRYFNMSVEDLPEIKKVNMQMLEEGLDAILPKTLNTKYDYYEDMNPLLGIATTRMRLSFGDTIKGNNLYVKAINRVLKRRNSFK